MAKVSIIDWIVKKLKRCIAIVEDGDTASQAIASGKYVIWKGNAYKASTAISQGDTLSLSNLTAVSDGIGNELNSNIATINENVLFKAYSFSVTGSTSVWTSPIRYKDVTIELPSVPSSPNQIYAESHNNQFWVASVTGADNSKNVTLRILTVATSDLSGIVTVWYQS